jgi:hypothetical protein
MFYRNTVEISETVENHLKAIVGGRQEVGRDGLRGSVEKVAEKTQGEGKATEGGERGWHSAGVGADGSGSMSHYRADNMMDCLRLC